MTVTAPGPQASGDVGAAPAPAVALTGLVRHHRAPRGRRGSAPVLATDDVSLEVPCGEVFGLLGPNGAGKTTLVRQLVGVLAPEVGTVRLFGYDVTGDPRTAARLVAWLAQEEPALVELPVGLAVETTGRLRGLPAAVARTRTADLLDELGLTEVAGRPMTTLSGGQRRLAQVATALIGDRPLLVLDEPTAGLDPLARRLVWQALRRRRDAAGTTVVLVTHNVLEAEAVLDRVAVLDRARVIACDTPGRLKALVSGDVRLELVWRAEPYDDPSVHALQAVAQVDGRRWMLRLPPEQARTALTGLTTGPALAALEDFTLATPTLEDVYLSLGGRARDLEHG